VPRRRDPLRVDARLGERLPVRLKRFHALGRGCALVVGSQSIARCENRHTLCGRLTAGGVTPRGGRGRHVMVGDQPAAARTLATRERVRRHHGRALAVIRRTPARAAGESPRYARGTMSPRSDRPRVTGTLSLARSDVSLAARERSRGSRLLVERRRRMDETPPLGETAVPCGRGKVSSPDGKSPLRGCKIERPRGQRPGAGGTLTRTGVTIGHRESSLTPQRCRLPVRTLLSILSSRRSRLRVIRVSARRQIACRTAPGLTPASRRDVTWS